MSAWEVAVPSRRYRLFTFGLLAVLVLPPSLREAFPGAAMIGPALFVTLVARVVATGRYTGIARAVLFTAMAAVALRGVRVSGVVPIHVWGVGFSLHLMTVLGFVFVVYEVLRHALAAGPVDADRLYAAVSAFLLIGMTFASVYEAMVFCQPSAFTFSNGHEDDADGLVYFSLVTLSTVGYGDVLPANPLARVLAVLEAILGQLYLAILMARLVGLHLNHSGSAEALASSSKDEGDLSSTYSSEAP
jgi:voltage-gated potassium channel